MTASEVMIGLRANIARVEARRVLLMARAFQISQAESTDKAADLMDLAEVSGEDKARADIQQWFAEQKARSR